MCRPDLARPDPRLPTAHPTLSRGVAASREYGLVAAVFGLLAALSLAWRGFSPRSHHLGGHGDGEMPFDWIGHYWNIWNHEQILAGHGSLFHTTTEFYPHGIDTLTIHDDLLAMLVAGLLAALTSVDTAHLAMVFFVLVGNALGGFVLVRTLTGNPWAGLSAGALLCFCSATTWTINTGNIQVGTLLWLCLYLASFHRLLTRGGWFAALFSASLAVVATLWFFAHLIHIALFSGVLLLFHLRELDRTRWVQVAATTVLTCLLVSPLAIAFSSQQGRSTQTWRSTEQARTLALREHGVPTTSVTFEQLMPWFERRPPASGTVEYGNMCGTYYVQYLLLLVALILCRKQSMPWLAVGGVFLLLSMGPVFRWGSSSPVAGFVASIPTPFSLAHEYVPFFHRLHSPQRFFIDVTLAAAVAMGYAIHGLTRFARSSRRPLIGSLLALVALVEFGTTWEIRHTPKLQPTAFYEWLADEPGRFAIIEYPFNFLDIDDIYLYQQTRHEKPLFNGLLPPFFHEDPSRGLLNDNRFLDRLVQLQAGWISTQGSRDYLRPEPNAEVPSGEDPYAPAVEQLEELGFRFLVVHSTVTLDSGRTMQMSPGDGVPRFLEDTLGPPVFWDRDLFAYPLAASEGM